MAGQQGIHSGFTGETEKMKRATTIQHDGSSTVDGHLAKRFLTSSAIPSGCIFIRADRAGDSHDLQFNKSTDLQDQRRDTFVQRTLWTLFLVFISREDHWPAIHGQEQHIKVLCGFFDI